MEPMLSDGTIGALGSVVGGLIGAAATVYVARMRPFLKHRRRNVGGNWIGEAEELHAFGDQAPTFARYTVSFVLHQFRSRVTGRITASSSDSSRFTDNIDGRLVTEQDLCFTFAAVDENVHDFGSAIFRVHPNGREMTGYVLSNESSSLSGRVFVMRAHMTRP
jgi:hypothetical protein